MEFLTMQKKIKVLEHAFAASAGAYYSINLTRDLVPGSMYQVIDDKEYSLNESMGLPENARFTDVVAYWGEKLPAEERPAYFAFLSIPNLLEQFHSGVTHVFHKYWTQSALFEPMLAEQHIVMYRDEGNGDILAITYVLDLTQAVHEEQYKRELEEKQVRLEAALQQATKARKYEEMQTALKAADHILSHITRLDSVTSEAELNEAMPGLLAAMGRYSLADRAYIFAWRSEEHQVMHMTHEWCADGVAPTIDVMQDLKMRDLPNWTPRLERGEAIVSMDWNAEKANTPEEFAVFDGQDIHSLIVIPIFASKRLNGYIGFDNPEQSMTSLSVRLLTSVGAYIGGVKENLAMMTELAEKQKSLQDSVAELQEEKNILDALSIDYTSVYYCDLENDLMIALKQGSYTNSAAAEHELNDGLQSYAFRIRYYFDHFIVQESAPDFLEKLSADYLRAYLEHNERFAYRFRAHPNAAGLQCFEVQIVRLESADGFKVVMGYRYIDDIIAEQEKQKIRLEKALADATLSNEIVGTISKIYWLIYRMDLVTGTYDEVSAGSEVHRLTGRRGRTDEVFREVRETVVCEEHQEMMEHFLDTSTLAERLKDTETIAMEYRAASGSWHLGRFIVKKRDESGRVTNVLYVVRQIDKQKQLELEYKQKLISTAEEARRANIAKTDFLRRMSHDIRTPINGIQGMIAIAEHFPDDCAKQTECRDKVKEASGFLLDLVNSILDMNKLESGSVVLEHKPFDLLELLHACDNITAMNGELKGLTIEIRNEGIRHTHLLGSPLHFKQVLQNVTGNAVKYTDAGGTLTLSAEELGCEGGKAVYRFVCKDTGRGMSREFVKHAFEPFTQEGADARTSYMGTGLGLSIAKQLIEMMGGTIAVESELNVGTTFTMTMPFVLDKDYTEAENEQNSRSDLLLTGKRVLVAEDNELNLEIAKFLLENAGIQVSVARNGREAVKLFAASAAGQFDLILMDIMMPEMDGLAAAQQIRGLDRPDAKTVPIVAMTANAFAEDIERSRAAGMNEHISKPLDEQKLLETVRRFAGKI